MKRARSGFTLIEVALFLAITSALFVGIAAGTQNSIFQQRYNDGVQNFAEWMRSIYSQVSNVQNENTGRSGSAIYGKVVTFGVDDEGRNEIKSYNLIGKAVEMTTTINSENGETTENAQIANCESGTVLGRLACLNANVVSRDNMGLYHTVGFVDDYTTRWDAQIQTTAGWEEGYVAGDARNGYTPYEGIVVVTRGTNSGSVYTYVLQGDGQLERIRDIIDRIERCEEQQVCDNGNPFLVLNPLDNKLHHEFENFEIADIDFCVSPNGLGRTGVKRDIRIKAGTKNASGVEVMVDSSTDPGDGNYDKCQI